MSAKIAGALILALPLALLAIALLWRRQRPVLWLALALIAVATGYLMATGATDDIARWLIPNLVGPPPVRA
jgi:dipeptide/tripeptide permease